MTAKEKGMLLDAHEVRAVLAGNKTQMRKVLVEQPRGDQVVQSQDCPYGKPGDRLWVREGFALQTCFEGEPPPFADGRPLLRRPESDVDGLQPLWTQAHYRATDPSPALTCERDECAECRDNDFGAHWQGGAFMPRWACRLVLEITGVRAERLRSISRDDAIAEGARQQAGLREWSMGSDAGFYATPQSAFLARFGGDDPWVWVLQFKRVEVAGA